ncbi:MAG TPA: hypothetical protein VGZ22_29690, partial [Isosphaeraceae bacterium]|nr:hypothetical protein [Isosphaeraceae bacterium]
RARLESLLRRYYLWVQGLPTMRQAELKLKDLGDQKRIELVKKFREAGPFQKSLRNRAVRAQLALLGQTGIFETARLLQIWSDLPRAQRDEIDNMKSYQEVRNRLLELAASRGFAANLGPTKEEWTLIIQHVNANPKLRKNFEVVKAKTKLAQAKHWAEASYFIDRDADVSSENLSRFEAILPEWIRVHLDPLPPEGARLRLAALYRLIYPPGTEMSHQEPKKDEASKGVGQPVPAPRPASRSAQPF